MMNSSISQLYEAEDGQYYIKDEFGEMVPYDPTSYKKRK